MKRREFLTTGAALVASAWVPMSSAATAQYKLKYAGNVTYGVTSRHSAECDNVGYSVLTIFANTVLDNFVAASILNVDINIGHADTIGV